MKTATMTLIKDRYGRIGWLGQPTTHQGQDWLDAQDKPFARDAVFHSAYPLSGGSVIVDVNDVEVLGTFDNCAAACEPRHTALVALWYALRDSNSPYGVPARFASILDGIDKKE